MKPEEIYDTLQEGQRVRVSYEGQVLFNAKGEKVVLLPGPMTAQLVPRLGGAVEPIPVDVTVIPERTWLRAKPAGVLHCVSHYNDGFVHTLCQKLYAGHEMTDKYPFATASCGACTQVALRGPE